MNRTIGIKLMAVGLALSLGGTLASCAQGGYTQRPNYPQQQPDYGQGNGQPPYDPRYDDQRYGQANNTDFYDDLAPHGQWVNTPEYGRVWIPNAGPDFQPYATNGHWVVTDYGNTWVSDYAWGWAPFHYGRWYQDRYRGWAWVPGNDWGPAWVSWRSGGGYYGWAPLGPGVNINVNVNIPWNQYVFVPQGYITSPRLYNYCVPRQRVVNIYQNTTIINNVYRSGNRAYAYGPRRDEIERVTRQSVPVYRIENSRRPGRDEVRGNSVGIYRPEASRGSSRSGADSRVYDAPFDNSGRGSSRGSGRYGSPNTNVPNAGTSRTESPAGTSGNGRTGSGERRYGDGTSPNPGVYPSGGNTTYPSGRGSSRGGQARPNYEVTPQPAPQVSQPSPQPPTRQESAPQRDWGGRRGAGAYSRPEISQPQAQPQAQPQPSGGYNGGRQAQQPQTQPQSQAQPQPQPGSGTYQSGRGSTRGPR